MEGPKEQQHRFLVNIELVGDVYEKYKKDDILESGDIFIDTIEWKVPFLPNVNDTFNWFVFISKQVKEYIEKVEDEKNGVKYVETISEESVVVSRSWYTEKDYTSCTLVISAKQNL